MTDNDACIRPGAQHRPPLLEVHRRGPGVPDSTQPDPVAATIKIGPPIGPFASAFGCHRQHGVPQPFIVGRQTVENLTQGHVGLHDLPDVLPTSGINHHEHS